MTPPLMEVRSCTTPGVSRLSRVRLRLLRGRSWTWVSLMNPHRLTWGYASDIPVALVIGLVTIAAWMMSKESKKVPWTGISVVMLLFVLWTNVTIIFAAKKYLEN